MELRFELSKECDLVYDDTKTCATCSGKHFLMGKDENGWAGIPICLTCDFNRLGKNALNVQGWVLMREGDRVLCSRQERRQLGT